MDYRKKELILKRECCNTPRKLGLYHKRETGSVLGVNPLTILRNVLTEDADSFLYLVFYFHKSSFRLSRSNITTRYTPALSVWGKQSPRLQSGAFYSLQEGGLAMSRLPKGANTPIENRSKGKENINICQGLVSYLTLANPHSNKVYVKTK